ncbi:MAG: hypothetical protein KC501_19005 [Myxococcales bacterium]|nr:hypothetical protein [Myxococcales bacterium]
MLVLASLGCPVEVPDPSPGFGSDTAGTATPTADDSTGHATGPITPVCGDGVAEAYEHCDCGDDPECSAPDLRGHGCTDVEVPDAEGPVTGGTLRCDPTTCRFDTSECTVCGDGHVDDGETCEPEIPLGSTCAELGAGAVGEVVCDPLTCQVDASLCTDCGVVLRIDGCDEGWSTEAANPAAPPSSWACGALRPGIGLGPYSGVWSTNLAGDYADDEASALLSPALELVGCRYDAVEIIVRHSFAFESSGPVITDGGVVQLGDGTSFETIEPHAGTLYDADALQTSWSPPDGQPGFSGRHPDEGQWVESRFRVEGIGRFDPPVLRFVFGSDGSGTDFGWTIDRVEVFEVPPG